jgi:hypothetical protein
MIEDVAGRKASFAEKTSFRHCRRGSTISDEKSLEVNR